MKRSICPTCNKPEVACICSFVTTTSNQVNVVILQHPKEVNHTKGTALLLAKSLKNSHVIVGESFDNNSELHKVLAQHHGKTFLLYPSEDALTLNNNVTLECHTQISCIVLLDATWRKAFKMFQLSSCLQALPQIKLAEGIPVLYEIRKTAKEGALSTLEACCHALSVIESDTEKYQPLLNSFVQFNQFQLSFRPSHSNDKN